MPGCALPTPPELTPWWQEATTSANGRRSLELFVSNVAEISTRAASLGRVAVAAVATDPEVIDVIAHHESLRRAAFRNFVDTLVARGLLKGELELTEATDMLLTLVGSEIFLDFVEGRGWSVDRYVAWTTETLCLVLLRDETGC